MYRKYLIYNQLFEYRGLYKDFVTIYRCKFEFVIIKWNFKAQQHRIWKSKTINQKFKNLNSFSLSCIIQNFALPL